MQWGHYRRCGLLHETDPSLLSTGLKASLYEDYESSLFLESNFVDDTPLIDPDEMFESSLTSLTFVTSSFSSGPIDTTVSALMLPASRLTLA